MLRTLFAICLLVVIPISVSYLLASCRKENPHSSLQRLEQVIPAGFPAPRYDFTDNPLTKEGFELGRKLFYDGRLSIDNMHPCSSCHQQIAGFGTFEHDRSHGVNNSHTLRNAPVLFNLAWSESFHWDGEFKSLRDEAMHPITGSNEMGESLEGIITKIQDDPEYREMFKEVFRYPFIRPEYILKALAQFTGYLTSANSKYDQYKKGLVSFFPPEERGYQLFRTNCTGCHPEPLFTDYSIRNIGLPVDNFLKDYGRMRVTGSGADSLKFKVPTLRNIAISSNYMHDGRFGTIMQCINHYRFGIQQGPTLDPLLTGGINLTDAEANDIFAFLRTLTDSSLLKDTRFAQP